MRLLFLIIASRNELYDKIKEYWQKIIDKKKFKQRNIYFIYNLTVHKLVSSNIRLL